MFGMICYLHTEGAGWLDVLDTRNDKNIMAISHPSCLHVWLHVKCSMGGPPEAKRPFSWHVCFAIHLLWEGYPLLTLFRLKDLQLIIALHLFGRPYYLRVNLLHWIYLHCRGIRMADIKDSDFFGSNKFSPADCPLDLDL